MRLVRGYGDTLEEPEPARFGLVSESRVGDCPMPCSSGEMVRLSRPPSRAAPAPDVDELGVLLPLIPAPDRPFMSDEQPASSIMTADAATAGAMIV